MTNTRSCTRLKVGARGWLKASWSQEYYPDDMPLEWRLAYYANEFPGVLVPAHYWATDAWPDTEQWREDVPERFRFFIELDGRLGHERLRGRLLRSLEALGERLGGVVLLVEERDTCSAIKAALDTYSGAPLVCAWDACADLAPIWRGPGSPCPCAPVGVLEPPPQAAPMQLRQIVESLAGCVVGPEAWLFAGDDLDGLRDLSDMARLLGL